MRQIRIYQSIQNIISFNAYNIDHIIIKIVKIMAIFLIFARKEGGVFAASHNKLALFLP